MITRTIEPVPPVANAALPFGPAGPAAFRTKEQCHRRRIGRAEPKNTETKSEQCQQFNRRQK